MKRHGKNSCGGNEDVLIRVRDRKTAAQLNRMMTELNCRRVARCLKPITYLFYIA